MHRRELRKEHSRVRPSKKKRDKVASRVKFDSGSHSTSDCDTPTGWETSHQNLSEIEALIDMIKGKLPLS